MINKRIIQKLADLIEEAKALDNPAFVERWEKRTKRLLDELVGGHEGTRFLEIKGDTYERLSEEIALLEALTIKLETYDPSDIRQEPKAKHSSFDSRSKAPIQPVWSTDVFVVHGNDKEVKEEVARFLTRIGLNPIILHEQPNNGMTIIEKLEKYSQVPFALVLLTPDDLGGVKGAESSMPRARQNVILELGYFMGALGRQRVCALYADGVELPSDFHGILYVKMDVAGGWKGKLAQEFVEAKLPIKMEGLLG